MRTILIGRRAYIFILYSSSGLFIKRAGHIREFFNIFSLLPQVIARVMPSYPWVK